MRELSVVSYLPLTIPLCHPISCLLSPVSCLLSPVCLSACLLVSCLLSACLLVSLSPCLLVSLSPFWHHCQDLRSPIACQLERAAQGADPLAHPQQAESSPGAGRGDIVG